MKRKKKDPRETILISELNHKINSLSKGTPDQNILLPKCQILRPVPTPLLTIYSVDMKIKVVFQNILLAPSLLHRDSSLRIHLTITYKEIEGYNRISFVKATTN